MLGTAERGGWRGNQHTGGKSETHDLPPEPMSKREKDERWYARKINEHWDIVERRAAHALANDPQLPQLRSPGRPVGDAKGSVRTLKDDRGETAEYLLARVKRSGHDTARRSGALTRTHAARDPAPGSTCRVRCHRRP